MALALGQTSKVRQALQRPVTLGSDVVLLLSIAGLMAAVAVMFGQAAKHVEPKTVIDLSFGALPKYTLLSLGRGSMAYLLSLGFTLVYGTVAAHDRRAERALIPAMDVFQALPVLAFLPGLVLTMVRLFPTREVGLEIACVVMIFTNQVPNMVFSFHGSLRGIPRAFRDVAAVQRLGPWKTFTLLEVPAAMTGLVWNSMMSMAGGWFFLTVNEAFTLNGRDYRLPGLGSYMNEAINRGDHAATVAALLAMAAMIVGVDQLFWRPVVAWSQRFRIEDSARGAAPRSWVLDLLSRSQLLLTFREAVQRHHRAAITAPSPSPRPPTPARRSVRANRILAPCVLLVTAGLAAWGAGRLVGLLLELPLRDGASPGHWTDRGDWLAVAGALLASFAHTSAAVALGAAWTVPVGILVGRSRRWSAVLRPVIQVLASFPAPMLYPLVVLLLARARLPFGVGCTALMMLGAQWYILFNVIAGAGAIPAELDDACVVYRLPRVERWRRLYLPVVFPYLVTGLVTAAGGAWNASIVAEYLEIGPRTFVAFGLGSKITQATADGQYPLLAACVVTMGLFVVMVNRFFWKRLYRLAESRYSLGA